MHRSNRWIARATLAAALSLGAAGAFAQQTPPPAGGGQGGQPRPAGQPGQQPRRVPEPGEVVQGGQPGTITYIPGDTAGFVSIFDGTLKNWDGDPRYWRAENNELVGESTAAVPVTLNNFMIWRGGTLKDFELLVDVKMSGTNSGIQFRSKERPEIAKWVMSGYQADMDYANNYPGNLYEERGRAFLAPRGQMTRLAGAGQRPHVIGSLGSDIEMRGLVKVGDWNQYHIIGRGNVITIILNGHVTAVFIDDDVQNRMLEGLLGFQMHVGPAFKVEFRNIYLKKM
jgi:hypothetical protein